jgi:hypothetical protein
MMRPASRSARSLFASIDRSGIAQPQVGGQLAFEISEFVAQIRRNCPRPIMWMCVDNLYDRDGDDMGTVMCSD